MFVAVVAIFVILIIVGAIAENMNKDPNGWGYMIPPDAEILLIGTGELWNTPHGDQFGVDHLQAAKQACERDARCKAVGLQASETIEYAVADHAGGRTHYTVAPLRWNLFTKKGVSQSEPYTQRVFMKSMWGGWW
jgi:hypothetical protein